MQEHPSAWSSIPDPPKPGKDGEFDRFVDTGGQGHIRRLLIGVRHTLALVVGGLGAWTRSLEPRRRRSPTVLLVRLFVAIMGLPVDRKLKRKPFPVQLRVRLERLGPTYIKLGQILALREDLLPRAITTELRKLLDRVPAVPYTTFLEQVTRALGVPVETHFAHIQSTPVGSASIGQAHVASTHRGEQVILKVVKPGIRQTLKRDTTLLRLLGWILQLFLPRYQPKLVIEEFCHYTLLEVDLEREADNAETFASAFRDSPDIVFPKIYRQYSGPDVLCMEYLEGIRPDDPRAQELAAVDRERLLDLGVQAIVRMLYQDGFFHADLHPGNLLVLPGPRCAFIDLGMVGHFDQDLRRSLLYYYYALVAGEPETASAYLASIARSGPQSDPAAFRREVEDISRQWSHRARFGEFSLAQLILQSIARGAAHRMYFPVEMVLMAKAIVTFESVGHMLVSDFDVAEISKKHVYNVLLARFGPLQLAKDSMTGLPGLVDALTKTPRLLTEGLRLVEEATRRPAENPLKGMRATLFGGFCMVAGAILLGSGGPWPLAAVLIGIGVLLPLRSGRYVPAFLTDLDFWKHVSIPFIAGVIGWVTNWLAIKLTFKPLQWVGIGPIGWQGIIPSKAAKMARIFVDRTMFRLGTLREVFQSMEPDRIAEHITQVIEPRLDAYTDEVMFYAYPRVWRMLPEAAKRRVFREVRREMPTLVHNLMAEMGERIEELLDFKHMLVERLENDRDLLNRLFIESGKVEFKFIVRSGLYFGFLFGLVQLSVWIFHKGWWVLPTFGLLVGYATNWFALNIVFRPLNPWKLGPFTLQGVFLKRQKEVSAVWCKIVAREIISMQQIIYAMVYGPRRDKVTALIHRHIRPVADEVVERLGLVGDIAVGEAGLERIRTRVGDKAVQVATDPFDHWAFNQERSERIEGLLRERMEKLPAAEFQDLLRPCFQEDELKLILTGAVLGLIAGVAQLVFVFGV